ncbi:MAG TPA: hypothetical protein DD635_03025 [Flavobacteriales bacterium]|nr:hypothetical protein [Flavobacteriales bacterium]
MVRLILTSLLGVLMSLPALLAQTTIDACNLFEATENEAWPFVLTAVESGDASSSNEQVFEIVIDGLPSEGASIRVAKTVANGNWYFGEPIELELGSNVVTVPAVSFARNVKFQFSSGDVAFSGLFLNYSDINTCVASTDGVPIAFCDAFEPGPNETWAYVFTAVNSDDPSSGEEQTLEIEVSALPEGGAEYRVAKTVANGNWYFGNPVELSFGLNTVTVSAVSFQRTVKFQFSSGDIEFTALSLNGEAVVCDANEILGCTDTEAENYDETATGDDGSCTYHPSYYCGTGTFWDETAGKCTAESSCTGDIDQDGMVAVSDLLIFLAAFGNACE